LNPLGDEYNFVSSAILARWYSFIDFETGVSGYSLCIGTEPTLCDVTELVSVGNASSYTWYNLGLVHDEEYFVSIKCGNNAGLSTNFTASQPISVDTTGTLLTYTMYFSRARVKAHKLLQVCKLVVTNLFTSCRQVVFALLVPSCCNKFGTSF
jgi:hypothetical protein